MEQRGKTIMEELYPDYRANDMAEQQRYEYEISQGNYKYFFKDKAEYIKALLRFDNPLHHLAMKIKKVRFPKQYLSTTGSYDQEGFSRNPESPMYK